jgi:phage FluMu gp28-like protein
MHWVGYQQRFLADRCPQIAVVKSRRIGFSEVMCFKAACRLLGVHPLTFDRERPVSQMVVSAGYEQAKDLLQRIMFHVDALIAVAGDALRLPRVKVRTKTLVEFDIHKLVIRAFSSNPRTMRGMEGDANIDEFAATANQEAVWAAMFPLTQPTLGNAEGYQTRIVGTPLGDGNLFYQICKGDRAKWNAFSVHEVTIDDAKRDGFPIDIEKAKREAGDSDIFNQEYRCSFLANNSRYISEKLYDSRIWSEVIPGNARLSAAGMDVARHGKHKAAIARLASLNDTLYTHSVESMRGTADEPLSWPSLEAWADEAVERCGTLALDASGLGDQFGERLEKRHGSSVIQVRFTLQKKDELFSGLRLALERNILWTNDDPAVRRAVLSIRRKFTQSGNTVYDMAEDAGGHGDEAVALALAVHAAGGATADVGGLSAMATTKERTERDEFLRPRKSSWRM